MRSEECWGSYASEQIKAASRQPPVASYKESFASKHYIDYSNSNFFL